jgi:hypothetical protein
LLDGELPAGADLDIADVILCYVEPLLMTAYYAGRRGRDPKAAKGYRVAVKALKVRLCMVGVAVLVLAIIGLIWFFRT